MSLPVSDVAFELLGACVHSLRFAFGGPLDYPYAPGDMATTSPPPTLFRRLQAASPPPAREGRPWPTGVLIDGRPFAADGWSGRLAEVKHEEGLASLDAPDPGTIVLDEWIAVERRTGTMRFPGKDRGRYLLSINYWNPIPPGADQTEKDVDYYGEYRLQWSRRPESDWVALSFDAFWPPERDSADILIPLGDCDESCPA